MIYTIANVTSTTAGTPVPLASARTPFNWCLITALNGNTSDIYIGGVNPTSKSTSLVKSSTTVGTKIAKGTTLLIPSISAVTYGDLQDLFIDVGTSGDGVSITYAIR
jgi:hypothetical protein